ncbi:hypothetical protein U725_02420 [Lactococcus cremoris subsp. cremoris GE214]|uniref:Thoeris anti-defense 2-like domain-containing protein n=2 Tax=Lactococcus lactis subsp. cremoris TaxID=1359 RepID=A0A084A8A7_LACLC|nr:hypothetical protein U725_02420 [Lactococcus cremoris subsp. cremoris GE214]
MVFIYLKSLELCYNEFSLFLTNMEEKMTFEEALALLKAGKKVVRTKGWSGAEKYVKLYDSIVLESGEKLEVTPYFLINVSGEGEGFSMWAPTPCDVLADDWALVE